MLAFIYIQTQREKSNVCLNSQCELLYLISLKTNTYVKDTANSWTEIIIFLCYFDK